MSWFKFDVRHGPGHQSHSIEYFWFDEDPSDEDLHDTADDFCSDMNWPIGDWEEQSELPPNVKANKIAMYQRQRAHAERMLTILEN